MTECLSSILRLKVLLPALLSLAWALPLHAELPVASGSVLSGASPASNAAPPEWLYTLRPGESFDEVAGVLLDRNTHPQQLLRHNGLASSTDIGEGDALRIPLSWLKQQPDPARAISVSGHVQHISGNTGRKQALSDDTLIRVGDEILSAAGTATVELADGSRLRISPHSRLIFNKLTQYGKSGMVDTRLRLDRGEVHTEVKPVIEGGSRFEIETPSAVAAVRGTMFSLRTSPGKTSLQVTEGEVSFGSPGRTRTIPAGYSASVSTVAGGNINIRRLAPAPVLDPLPPQLNRLPAQLSWQASAAPAHQLDIFDAESGQWVDSRKVTGNEYNLSLLDNGTYEVHLAALDNRGMAGMPGTVEVEVNLRARAAELIAPEPDASVDDDMPEFRWELRGNNEVARLEIAEDPSFRNLIATSEWAPETSALPNRPLTPGTYHWRVVSEAGGNSVATSEPSTFTVNGTLPPVRIISVNYVDNQVRVFWESVATASDYRLQLAEEPGFDNIIKEATLADTTAALRLIPGRRYFVRLKALSDGPLASRWGPGRELYLE